MSTFWEPPPLASVAALCGMVAITYALMFAGRARREAGPAGTAEAGGDDDARAGPGGSPETGTGHATAGGPVAPSTATEASHGDAMAAPRGVAPMDVPPGTAA